MNTQHIDYTEEIPILTEMAGQIASTDLPILTEIVAAAPLPEIYPETRPETQPELQPEPPSATLAELTPAAAPATPASAEATPFLPRELTAAEMQQLLQHLEQHLDTVFTRKLDEQLIQLQKLAVDLAVSELKTELPTLLRAALR